MTPAINDNRQPLPIVRIFASERDKWFCDLIAVLVHDLARLGISLVVVTPSTPLEQDLLERAAAENWDLAFLMLNNVLYSSHERSAEALEHDSIELVQIMVRLFKKPIIACYGYPDAADFPARLLVAGATAAFQLPCDPEEMQQAIKRCLPIW